MKNIRFHLCLLALLGPSFAADVVIRNVNIVDVQSGTILPHRSILIHGGVIRSIAANAASVRGAQIVDGHNRYVIPGLWDMHVHLWHDERQFPLYLAWGVTGVRDMGSDLDQVRKWRAEIRKSTLLAPHIETCGPPIDGAPSKDPKEPVLVVRSPAEARNAYNELEEQYHVDFISLRSGLSRDAYFALIERARMWGLPVAGDVPEGVTFDEAVGERQSSIEHLSGAAHALDGDSENAAALLDRMAKFGSYQVPALIKLRRMTYADADEVIRDPHLKEIPAAIRKSWTDPRLDEAKFSLEALDQLDLGYQRSAEIVARMQRCNVPIMAGTDTGDPYTFPGLDLHRELRLLVKAGLTPLQALRSATLTPAQFLELDDTLGTVATGKTADLVLLDADPLQDIGNTEKIAAVVIAGRYFTKAKLDAAVGQSR